jgi:hypothetical protein
MGAWKEKEIFINDHEYLLDQLYCYHTHCCLMTEMISMQRDRKILPKILKSFHKDIHIEPIEKKMI